MKLLDSRSDILPDLAASGEALQHSVESNVKLDRGKDGSFQIKFGDYPQLGRGSEGWGRLL